MEKCRQAAILQDFPVTIIVCTSLSSVYFLVISPQAYEECISAKCECLKEVTSPSVCRQEKQIKTSGFLSGFYVFRKKGTPVTVTSLAKLTVMCYCNVASLQCLRPNFHLWFLPQPDSRF
ncbi:hypothetical protein AV530_019705 [Patagioenas fasciata monilis]|uniref:Uncharacterized protein n=1 Tax=Patagioenas fasciata monilis TaxID=372326 RepID=A0A1V4JEA3_PATFA|nr:hypothetical protein AV530_019705 [Patagioenas fasciata monilis]